MNAHALRFESEPDPQRPGRTAYRITGLSACAVQKMIDRVMNDPTVRCASFVGPVAIGDGQFGSLGEAYHLPYLEVA